MLRHSRRGGGDLLSHFRSIIGVARFNFSVRNGKRWSPCAIATLVSFCCPAISGPDLPVCSPKRLVMEAFLVF